MNPKPNTASGPLGKDLRILMLEDSPTDGELNAFELREAGFAFTGRRVETKDAFVTELDTFSPDLILADYSLPGFDGQAALQIVQAKYPDVPFVFVSGTLGEETAVESLKLGATDYVLKHNLDRLGPVVKRALREADERLQRKQAEQALRASEERFRALIEQGSDIVAIVGIDATLSYITPSVERLLGYTPEDLIGESGLAFVEPDDLQYALAALAQLQDLQGALAPIELRVRHKDGLVRMVEVTARNLLDNPGVQGIAVNFRDITERKQAEIALNEERSLLSTLIDSLPDAVYVKDLQGRIILDNVSNRRNMAGLAGSEETLGKTDFDFHARELAEQFYADEQAIIRSGQALIDHEEMQIDAQGKRAWHLTTKVPLRDQAGKTTAIVGISRDITERKRAEEELGMSEAAEREQRILAETLASVTLALTSQLGLEGVFDEILGQAQRLVPNSASQIALLESNLIRPVRWQGYERFGSESFVARQVQALADSPLDTETVQLRKPVIVSDTRADPRWKIFEETAWIRSAIGAPICLHDRVLGVVWLESAVPNTFTVADAARVQPLTAAAAIALENARLFDQAQREIAERQRAEQAERQQRVLAEVLLESSATLTSTLDPAQVMNRILENVGRVIAHDSANVMLIDGDAAVVAYWRGYPADLDPFIQTLRFALDTPNLRQMLDSRSPILVDDVSAYPAWVRQPETAWIRSYAAAPIQAHGQIIGFLNIDGAEPQRFSALDAKGLQAFANQAAIAIENAQLYDELRRHAAELERRVELRTAELYQAKEHLETIFNSSTDAIVVVGRDGLIEQKNPAFTSLFGYQPSEALGRPIVALAGVGSVEGLTGALRAVVDEAAPRQIELVAERKDGTRFDADLVLSPIVGPGQQTVQVICNARDITQRKQIESGLRQMVEKERELGELRSRFVSMASHDFRTPLAVILSSASMLKLYNDKMAAEARLKHLDRIQIGVKQMTDLLDDVLTFAQGEEGRLDFAPLPVDLESLCRQLLEETQIASGETHEFVFSSAGSCADALVDKKLLRQIVTNLLSNAAKYSPDGSQVQFDLTCEGGRAVLRVQDHGLGIPEQDQARLFEPFHRAGNVTAVRGTGLGLAIVKKAVDLHGGSITFESQVGVGTTFTVVIPTSQKARL